MNDETKKQDEKKKETRPDETGTIHVSEHIKIFDPNTGEQFLNKRES